MTLPADIIYLIMSYVPELVCQQCGSFEGSTCECWTHEPLRVHPIGDLYDLGIDCARCTYGQAVYCTCHRVRDIVDTLNARQRAEPPPPCDGP